MRGARRLRDELEGELAASELAKQQLYDENRALEEDKAELAEKNKRLKTVNDTYHHELKTIS